MNKRGKEMDISSRHMKAILTAFAFAVLLSGCGSGCGTLGVDNTSPCGNATTSDGSTADNSTFNILGRVIGNASQGVTISLSGAATANTTTDANGNYSFTALPTGGYTVVPSVDGNSFNPASTAVTISGADVTVNSFFATSNTTAGTFSISVTVSGDVKQNVLITLSGANTGSALTDPNGNFSFSNLLANTAPITLTPRLDRHTFSPQSNTVSLTTKGNAPTINFTESATQ
jgi:hypothetical protein